MLNGLHVAFWVNTHLTCEFADAIDGLFLWKCPLVAISGHCQICDIVCRPRVIEWSCDCVTVVICHGVTGSVVSFYLNPVWAPFVKCRRTATLSCVHVIIESVLLICRALCRGCLGVFRDCFRGFYKCPCSTLADFWAAHILRYRFLTILPLLTHLLGLVRRWGDPFAC